MSDYDSTIKPCPLCGGEMVLVFKSELKAFVFYHKNYNNNKCYEYFKLRLTPSVLYPQQAREYWNLYRGEENNIIPVKSHSVEDVCSDNETINRYKKKFIESTNIEPSLLEMEVLDGLLYHFWQLGWLREEKGEEKV